MTDIIEAIDNYTTDRYSAYNKKIYGFCELIRKSAGEGSVDHVFPKTIPSNPNTEGIPVSLDDRFSLITWTRWAENVNYETSEEWSFGKSEARLANLPLRIIFAHKSSLGEELVFDFMNSFPSKFSVTGFKFVHVVSTPTIDPDHEGIYKAELGNTVYEKHRFTWNLYAVTVNLQFIMCDVLTP